MNKASMAILSAACFVGFHSERASAQPPTPLVLQAKIGGGVEGSIVKNDEGSFTVIGGGIDIWDAADAFTFHYFEVAGDFDVRVRVESFEPVSRWSKAGLMARESLSPGSRMAFAYLEPPNVPVQAGGGNGANDAVFGYRTGIPGAGSNGGQHADPETGRPAAGYPNAWLRLQRTGDRVTTYHGTTGSNWALLATQDTTGWQTNGVPAPLSNNLLLGLGVTVATLGNWTARAEFREFGIAAVPPEIVQQPAEFIANQGGLAMFRVTANGTTPIAYQWRHNSALLPGATNALLNLENVQPVQAGAYTVVVNNAFGSVTSAPAALMVNALPIITAQPTNLTVAIGNNAIFTVMAAGTPPLSYQWWFMGSPLFGFTAPTLFLDQVQLANAGPYTVTVNNPAGSITSVVATLTLFANAHMAVLGNGLFIANGDTTPVPADATQFGSVPQGSAPRRRTFTARNVGAQVLQISNVIVPDGFTLSEGLPAILSPGQSDTFTVDLTTSIQGVKSGQIIITNDGGANPFQFTIAGEISAPPTPFVEQTRIGGGADGSIAKNGEGSFSVVGGGTDIWGVSDGFTFHHYSVSGDFDVRVRVESFVGSGYYQKAGLMVRESVAPDSRMAYIYVTPSTGDNTARFGYRTGIPGAGANGGDHGEGGGAAGYPNAWLRLKREGNRIVSYQSTTGSNWSEVASQDTSGWQSNGVTLPLSATLQLGLAVTRANSGAQTVPAEFREYSVVILPPEVLQSPVSQVVNQGQAAMFHVTVAGTPPFAYQWRRNGTPVSGATNADFTLTNAQSSQAGDYSVVITNAAGSITSASAALTIVVPPTITAPPGSQTIAVGSNATFNVVVNGSAPFSYQWRFNDLPLPGKTAATLALTNVQASNAGPYSVTVSNPAGAITSAVATLTVYTNYGRFLRIASSNTTAGATLNVPVMMSALGDENGLGFSLGFDATVATVMSATVGSNTTAATLSLNTNQVAGGRVGMNLVLPAGTTLSAGTQEVVVLTFSISPASGDLLVPLVFLDQPVIREVSDVLAEPLATIYFNGNLNIGGAIEGDVTPLPNGNGVVTATDWVKIGRYSSGVDAASNGIQFQRTDCAPRSSLGSGTLSVGDWVQAGRYVASLDPPTSAGGPTLPPGGFAAAAEPSPRREFAAFLPAGDSRMLRVVSQGVEPGLPFQTSLMLESHGDETALGLSLSFNPQWIQFTSFTLGAHAVGATLNVNTNQSNTGRLAIAISLPIGGVFQAGTRELVRLGFHAGTNQLGVTSIAFSDQPSPREISDAFANALPATYLDGQITISPPLPPSLRLQPPLLQPDGHYLLRIENANGSAIASNRLQRIDLLTAPSPALSLSNWIKVTNLAVLTNGVVHVDDAAVTNVPRRFYRAVERP